jgi:hypothetical protein
MKACALQYFSISEARNKHATAIFERFFEPYPDHIFDNAICSIGKTYTAAKIIAELIQRDPSARVIYIVETHAQAEGFGNIHDMLRQYNVDFMHEYGKGQRIRNRLNDTIPDPSKYMCMQNAQCQYFPGCRFQIPKKPQIRRKLLRFVNSGYTVVSGSQKTFLVCNFIEECEYIKQRQEIHHLFTPSVIITTFENMRKYDCTHLFIDESFENKLLSFFSFPVSKKQLMDMNFTLLPVEDTHQSPETHNFTYIKIIPPSKIVIEDDLTYWLKTYCDSIENIYFKDSHQKTGELFGLNNNYLPSNRDETYLPQTLFMCATSSELMVKRLLNQQQHDTLWYRYQCTIPLKNPIMRVNLKWNIGTARLWSRNMFALIEHCLKMTKKPILIITKEEFTDIEKMELEYASHHRVEFVHYGEARGSNKWDKEYGIVIQYGRYAYTPTTRHELKLIGFDTDEINDMQTSEMRQAFYRSRPHKHPKTPILMFLPDHIIPTKDSISPMALMRWIDSKHKSGEISRKEMLKQYTPFIAREIIRFDIWLNSNIQ